MLRARKGVTRRSVIAGAGATALVTAAEARPVALRPSRVLFTAQPIIQSFDLAEHSNVTSLGFKRGGLLFEQGDIPTGQRPVIKDGSGATAAAQFDAVSRYPDGSIRFCTFALRTTNFSGNEIRSYTVVAETGSIDNTSSGVLADITGATNFTLDFTSIVGSTSGAVPNHTASFNTHAAIPTRVTRYESGGVVDSWEVWGMASNGGVAHPHLQTIGYASRWKNSDGSTAFFEFCFVVAQHWWSISAKEKLTYTATLKNSGVTIETYGGSLNSSLVRSPTVEHVYGMQWATVRLDDDNEHATRHCIGASRPTLLYKPDQLKWEKVGACIPLDTSYPWAMPTYYFTGLSNSPGSPVYNCKTYQPGSAFVFNGSVDNPGGSAGRGAMTNSDALAFGAPTAANIRANRTHSFASLHVPFHYRSNHIRTRPIDSGVADVANTIISLILWDSRGTSTPSSYYDFQADGMPAPVHAYRDSRSVATEKDGFVVPGGGRVSGTTTWSDSPDASHAANYAYLVYLREGERYFMKSMLDLGMDVTHRLMGGVGFTNGVNGGMPDITAYDNATPAHAVYPGATAAQYAGVALRQFSALQSRTVGWAANCIRAMVFVPDAAAESRFVKQYVANNAVFAADYAALIPASNFGRLGPSTGQLSPWMDEFAALSMYPLYRLTRDPNWLPLANFAARNALQWIWNSQNYIGGAISFHAFTNGDSNAQWDSSTNPFFTQGWFSSNDAGTNSGFGASINAATNTFTQPRTGAIIFDINNGDMAVTNTVNNSAIPKAPPVEMTVGQVYYMVNVNNVSRTFQLALTPGGPAHNFAFSQDYTDVVMGYRLQDHGRVPPTDTNAISPDGYAAIATAAMIEAYRNGHPDMTSTMLSRAVAWYNAVWVTGTWGNRTTQATWAYVPNP